MENMASQEPEAVEMQAQTIPSVEKMALDHGINGRVEFLDFLLCFPYLVLYFHQQ